MKHSDLVRDVAANGPKSLAVKATGKFYTPESIGRPLADEIVRGLARSESLSIVDPFGGDGRLLSWLVESLAKHRPVQHGALEVFCFDIDQPALAEAKQRLEGVMTRLGVPGTVHVSAQDSFAAPQDRQYDCVVTNPPWETLKPDARELATVDRDQAMRYREALGRYDTFLKSEFPLSQPARKFSGWGTNLSRPGVELSVRLTTPGGMCGFVAPASLLADQGSVQLRRWLLGELEWLTLWHFPAEARCFESVDSGFVVATCRRTSTKSFAPTVTSFDSSMKVVRTERLSLSADQLASIGHVIPIEVGSSMLTQFLAWADLPKIAELENDAQEGLWLGRELDETRRAGFLVPAGRFGFLKGQSISRFHIATPPKEFVDEGARRIPPSASHARVAWRDVSRRSQKRRMHAAIIPPGVVTGNSLHVGYFRDDDRHRLEAMLALLNSFCVEAQIRSFLATGHISLGVVRSARIPPLDGQTIDRLSLAARHAITNRIENGAAVEVAAAQAFKLSRDAFAAILDGFLVPAQEREELLKSEDWQEAAVLTKKSKGTQLQAHIVIPNHYSASLSELDLATALAVKPGGNWKSIPPTIPSKRLQTIRESFKAGEGSRSTYYGRLRPDTPAYTINTYFTRPGNGCHLHYDYEGGQHRVMSEREAARFQSFPDGFRFLGSHAAIAKQIGNAVPPLLGYQVARSLGSAGQTIDLFCGAGGLSLGFIWAGWRPLTANDIDTVALQTYCANVHSDAVAGSIQDSDVFDDIVRRVEANRDSRVPLVLLGGPPCQGFSTAGKPRSMEDERNQLFQRYRDMLTRLHPDGFIFENVTGLLNMDGGRVFELVRSALTLPGYTVTFWKLRAEQYGIPQRRTRVFIVGYRSPLTNIRPPSPITEFGVSHELLGSLTPAVTAAQAIGDLPSLRPGEDGSMKSYRHEPSNWYQQLMRGQLTAEQYVTLMNSPETADTSIQSLESLSVSSLAART